MPSRDANNFVPTLNMSRISVIGSLQPHVGPLATAQGSSGSLSRRLQQGGSLDIFLLQEQEGSNGRNET